MIGIETVMILGAGPSQVSAIKKAVRLGYHVITVDYLPDNVGHKHSHRYVNCSTTDKEGVLRAASQNHVDGITTFCSDVAVPTVAYVSTRLGLPGFAECTAEVLSYKDRFREFQETNELDHPDFVSASSPQELMQKIAQLHFPVVFKPVDYSGSRGVSRVDRPDTRSWRHAFEHAWNFSRSGRVIAETFTNGIEVGGDAFLTGGRVVFAAISQKYLRGFVPTGHRFPTFLSENDQRRVVDEIEMTCRAAGYTEGALNYDIMVAPEQISVIEMSPRTGGNGIQELVERAFGVDLVALALQTAVSDPPSDVRPKTPITGCGSWILGSRKAGLLTELVTADEVMKAVPEVFDFQTDYQEGNRVPAFTHSGNRIGRILFDCRDAKHYARIVRRLARSCHFEVEGKARRQRTK